MTDHVVDLGDAAQARLEVEDRARRRHEKIAGDEDVNECDPAQRLPVGRTR